MSDKTANICVERLVSVPVKGKALQFLPGRHLVPEAVADRIVAAQCGQRIRERGRRLAAAMKAAAHETE